MEAQFWIKAWQEGRTGFHKNAVNEKLVEFYSKLGAKANYRVLVPLCGKTKDLLWLSEKGLHVEGVELHEQAVQEFFTENHLSPVLSSRDETYSHYIHKKIHIRSGDFFKLQNLSMYDFVYDRASLVALPKSMRSDYVKVIERSLKPHGKCLLIVYEYDQTKMDGPPFSISQEEIQILYGNTFKIELLKEEHPMDEGPRLGAVIGLEQKVYLLEKN